MMANSGRNQQFVADPRPILPKQVDAEVHRRSFDLNGNVDTRTFCNFLWFALRGRNDGISNQVGVSFENSILNGHPECCFILISQDRSNHLRS